MGIPYKERIRIMDNLVITIAREFGSGGRSIGKMLSEKLFHKPDDRFGNTDDT